MKLNPTPTRTPTAVRRAALAALSCGALTLAGCSSLGEMFSGDKIDYKTSTAKTAPLEVPPDLSQLARDGRYQPQGGVVSASTVGQPAAAGAVAAGPAVAVAARGEARVERQGQQRWLVVPQTPEQLWPLLRDFWVQRGFKLTTDDAQLGVMETDWSENRAKLPNDIIRNTFGRVFGNLYDTGERDRFRTRVERTATGSEVFISHRGAEEAYVSDRRDEGTRWRFRATDPQLEAEFLTRLLVSLGTKDEPARTLVAAAPESPARARSVVGKPSATMEVDEPFDRAWRRVGLALDRSGFTVEDRDRSAGLYYVRYINPANAGKEEPGWWAKLFGDSSNPQAAVRYRIQVQGSAERTTISVLTSAGAPESGDDGKRIVAVLVGELK